MAPRAYLDALLLPEPVVWFKTVFGEKSGGAAGSSYAALQENAVSAVADALAVAVRDKMNQVEVHRFDDACDPAANEHEYPILAARQVPEALYSVLLSNGEYGTSLSFFAWDKAGFRYVGTDYLLSALEQNSFSPRIAAGTATAGDQPSVRAAGQVQSAKLIHEVQPKYPGKAMWARLEGTVRLLAVVGTDGTIKSLRVLQGRCWLAEAAVEAVRQWQYSPTLVDGKPVEIVTTIDVVFALRVHP